MCILIWLGWTSKLRCEVQVVVATAPSYLIRSASLITQFEYLKQQRRRLITLLKEPSQNCHNNISEISSNSDRCIACRVFARQEIEKSITIA